MKDMHLVPPHVSLAHALRYWLKLGFISFGGPAGQIALMHTDLVDKHRWISEQRFLHALNYCMLLPGPEATQLAIYIGWLMHGTWGGIAAGALFILPSLTVLILLSWLYLAFGNMPLVVGILYGIKPAVVAIVLAAASRIALRTLTNAFLAAIAIAAFGAIAILHAPFPLVIAAVAAIGWIGSRVFPDKFRSGAPANVHAAGPTAKALIDDDTPTPLHAYFSWRRLACTLAGGAVPVLIVWACLGFTLGFGSPLPVMAAFFAKAAMLTFGGAYAVLPYIYQGAVASHHWLTPAQMIDGLALGETTPGPLIMIVAFVGFVGGWTQPVFGDEHLLLSGIAGASTVAFFTFFPSFVFILAGGPLVESTRNNIRAMAPLTAISAAAVGVIASLAVFFSEQVFRLSAPVPQWDFLALGIAIAAAIALLRFKAGIIKLLLACALGGLVVSYLR